LSGEFPSLLIGIQNLCGSELSEATISRK
jgi:hypothetical protein